MPRNNVWSSTIAAFASGVATTGCPNALRKPRPQPPMRPETITPRSATITGRVAALIARRRPHYRGRIRRGTEGGIARVRFIRDDVEHALESVNASPV